MASESGFRRITAITAALVLSVGSVSSVMGQDAESPEPMPTEPILVGLVTKTETNPFFVMMRNRAQAKAEELGMQFQSCAGAYDTDNEGQVTCIDNLIAAGANGLLITPSVPDAIVPTIQRARDAGMLTIALDTQTNPPDAVDATLATDNYLAGLLIGQWAVAKLGDEAENAVIGFLDASEGLQITTEVQRNQGFMEGFGIDPKDNTFIGDEDDPRIAGFASSLGDQAQGRTAMENLLAANPDINVVYTINEPAAAGAYEAINAAGRADDVLIVSVDGGCPGVQNVADGVIGATSMQFPALMADMGVQAVFDYVQSGGQVLPEPTEGLEFTNTGVTLITDEPQEGVESEDTDWGLENCWG
jgi:fructose transport system substrate-binding protein